MDADHTHPHQTDNDPPRHVPTAASPRQPGSAAHFLRQHRPLTTSVALLFGAVVGVMSLSLASCNSTGRAGAPGGVADAPSTASREEAKVLARVPAASLSNITAEPEMRIRLAAGIAEVSLEGFSGATASAKPGAPRPPAGPVFLGPIGGQAGPMECAAPLKVQMTAEGWLLTDGAGRALRLQSPGELVVSASAAGWSMEEAVPPSEQKNVAPGPMVVVTPVGAERGAPYPGRIWLLPRSDLPTPAFDVIEHVGMEKYLVGVVVKEMYNHWPREAFKVQAVAARTYALHERSRRSGAGVGGGGGRSFDVESNTRDQAYSGASTNRNAIEAVNATRGVVMAYEGELVRTYYSSTCGGRTGAAKDTWPTTKGYEYNLVPPIQAQTREFLCQDSPIFTWTVTRTADDLTRRIRAFGEAQKQLVRQLAGIHALEPLELAPTGRPSVYKLTEPGGKWYKIKAEDLRLACNTNAPGLPAITAKTRVNSGDIAFKVTRPASSAQLTGQQLAAATSVEIAGRGFGHGVGMCQYCARAMAARGDTWQPMLERFYPGAEIVKAYR